jgi:hypothetical protein
VGVQPHTYQCTARRGWLRYGWVRDASIVCVLHNTFEVVRDRQSAVRNVKHRIVPMHTQYTSVRNRSFAAPVLRHPTNAFLKPKHNLSHSSEPISLSFGMQPPRRALVDASVSRYGSCTLLLARSMWFSAIEVPAPPDLVPLYCKRDANAWRCTEVQYIKPSQKPPNCSIPRDRARAKNLSSSLY